MTFLLQINSSTFVLLPTIYNVIKIWKNKLIGLKKCLRAWLNQLIKRFTGTIEKKLKKQYIA